MFSELDSIRKTELIMAFEGINVARRQLPDWDGESFIDEFVDSLNTDEIVFILEYIAVKKTGGTEKLVDNILAKA